MPESSRRPLARLAVLGAALAALLAATPSHADPRPHPQPAHPQPAHPQHGTPGTHPGPPAGAGKSAQAPGHAAGAPGRGPDGRSEQEPPRPPAGGPAAPPADLPDTSSAAPGRRVVICKYVRKPGTAEVASHVIVVNQNALMGKGFAGTFPYPFSDGQLRSVAIRYAAPGEQAREISVDECGSAPLAAPPAEDDPSTGGETTATLQVGGGVVEADPVAAGGSAERAQPGKPGATLPATGASAYLLPLGLLGAVTVAGGAGLMLRRRSTH